MKTHTVTITKSGGELEVVPVRVEISKKKGEKVKWECAAGSEIIIDFGTNCPFDDGWYNGKKKGKKNLESGRISYNAGTNKYYKYLVRCCGLELDPQVSIKP